MLCFFEIKKLQVQDAWTFIRFNNMVNESCYPMTGNNNECQINFQKKNLVQCLNSNVFQQIEFYKATDVYHVLNENYLKNNEANIIREIIQYGSATMEVYEDFMDYKSGIYNPSNDAEFFGYLSVRIIGWGEESNGKYWIGVNSWGTSWGENGYFKIVKGINACSIENYVIGVEV